MRGEDSVQGKNKHAISASCYKQRARLLERHAEFEGVNFLTMVLII